jgi:ketosteroid isomerase-like protein
VLHVIEHRAEAQRTHDAHAERTIYAPDAVWINAFGRRQVGPDSIEAFLGRLYADSGYAVSRLERQEMPQVRFIRPDVAVVHEYHEREGQRLADGSIIPIRRVYTVRPRRPSASSMTTSWQQVITAIGSPSLRGAHRLREAPT